jgi:hypothetical protein
LSTTGSIVNASRNIGNGDARTKRASATIHGSAITVS